MSLKEIGSKIKGKGDHIIQPLSERRGAIKSLSALIALGLALATDKTIAQAFPQYEAQDEARHKAKVSPQLNFWSLEPPEPLTPKLGRYLEGEHGYTYEYSDGKIEVSLKDYSTQQIDINYNNGNQKTIIFKNIIIDPSIPEGKYAIITLARMLDWIFKNGQITIPVNKDYTLKQISNPEISVIRIVFINGTSKKEIYETMCNNSNNNCKDGFALLSTQTNPFGTPYFGFRFCEDENALEIPILYSVNDNSYKITSHLQEALTLLKYNWNNDEINYIKEELNNGLKPIPFFYKKISGPDDLKTIGLYRPSDCVLPKNTPILNRESKK